MANNTTLNTMTGGDIVSDDQITTLNGGGIATGEKVQRVKIAYGAVGAATDVQVSAPLPVGEASAFVSTTTTVQNAVAVTGNGTNLTVTGYGTALVQITGTFVATVNFEASNDAGTTWDAISATKIGTSIIAPTATATGQYRLTVTGFDLLRARVTWTSGTSITINGRVTNAVNSSKIVMLAPSANTIGNVGINGTVPVSLATAPTTPVTGTFFQATQPVSLATAPTTPVTGTFFQATQPVSLATAPTTPVTGTFFQATQPVSGTVSTGLTQPLTDTQLRASAVPISLATAPTTPVTGTFFQATQPVSMAANTPVIAAGTNAIGKVAVDQTTNIIAATTMQNAAVAVGNGTNLNVQGYVSALINLTGTMGASTAVTFEASVDDVTFVSISGHQIGLSGNLSTTTTNTGDFRFNVAAYKSIRARISTFGTGSVTAKGYVSVLAGHSTTVNSNIIAALPAGTAIVGKFGIDQTTPGTTNLVAISGTVPVSQKAATSTSATLQAAAVATGNGATISTDGMSAAMFTVSGTYVGTITFEGTEDGTNYTSISTTQLGTAIISSTTTTVGVFEASVAGLLNVRARLTWTSGASVTVTAHAVPINFATRNINANIVSQVALPTGTNTVGAFNIAAGQTLATVSTVSAVTAITNALPTGANTIGAVTGPAAAALALDATLTGGTQQSKITDGTNIATVKAASTAAVATDKALVVALSPNNPVTTSAPVDTAGAATLSAQNANPTTGVATANSALQLSLLNGQSMVGAIISGSYTGTLTPQVSIDGTTWVDLAQGKQWFKRSNGNFLDSIIADTGAFQIAVAGFNYFRVSFNAAMSGSAVVNLRASTGANQIVVGAPLPAGTFQIGNVGQGGTWNVNQTDGTNIANVLKSDGTFAGNNSQLVAPAVQQISFTTSTAGAQNLLANTDVSHYSWMEIVYTSVGVGLTLTGQFSPTSGGSYFNSASFSIGTSSTPLGNLGVLTGFVYSGPIRSNFFQIAISALTSGTFTGTLTLRTFAQQGAAATSIGGSIGSNSATGSTVPAAAFYMGTQASGGTLAGLSSSNNVTDAGGGSSMATGVSLYNGTNWDRTRSNYNTTTGDTGVKTASFTGATQTNFNQQAAYITVLCGTVSGTTPTLVAQLQFSPDAGTTWLNIGPATTAITLTANTALIMVGPENWSQAAGTTAANLTTGATAQIALNAPLPRTWRLNYTIGGTTPSFAITAVYVNYVGV